MATGKLKMWDVERGFGFVGDADEPPRLPRGFNPEGE